MWGDMCLFTLGAFYCIYMFTEILYRGIKKVNRYSQSWVLFYMGVCVYIYIYIYIYIGYWGCKDIKDRRI